MKCKVTKIYSLVEQIVEFGEVFKVTIFIEVSNILNKYVGGIKNA